ncbi:MAG: alcohol acetyltransferase [Clostridia bacterium]|nr:alcohol acetyltransferase [Clostridia bacterium]
MKKKIPLRQRTWYKLDNAAKVFPGQNSSSWSNVFRLSATLTEKVNPELLEKAVSMVMPRFPTFDVRMRAGFFWHYLEKNPYGIPPVLPDIANPCQRFKWKENNGYLFKVYYYEKRISVEFYHSVTDGYGGSCFFMTLVAVYLRLTGKDIPCGDSVFDINEKPKPEEAEDSYYENCNSKAKAKRMQKFAYHFKGERFPKHFLGVTTGYIPVSVIKEKAKEHNVTVTEYLAAILLFTLYNLQKQENKRKEKPVGIQIPVNLRSFFRSTTLRNFMLCYTFQIDPNMGEYTLPEIIKQLSLYLRFINNEKEVQAMMKGNIGFEKNPVMRILPSVLKDFGISMVYKIAGEKQTSCLITNVGVLKAPKEMENYIEKICLITGPAMINGARCGVLSYKDTLAFTFSNIYKDPVIQREFFTTLIKLGIPVKIESNRHLIKGGEN